MDKEDVQAFVVIGLVASIVILVFAAFFGFTIATVVGAGESGVKFNYFSGGVQDDEFGEGLKFKVPWVRVDKFSMKTQDYTMTKVEEEGVVKRDDRIHTLTKEGLCVDLDITVLYKIEPGRASDIRQTIGKDGQYQEIVIRPTIRNAVRDVVVNYNAMDIYGDERAVIEYSMHEMMYDELIERGILVEDLLIRDVSLPDELSDAIKEKKTAEQDAMRMDYIIVTETKEKERRIIEAEGISKANDIIAGSLTTEYLTWYWIDNLDTHNSVIYVPVGEAGLPLFKEVEGRNNNAGTTANSNSDVAAAVGEAS